VAAAGQEVVAAAGQEAVAAAGQEAVAAAGQKGAYARSWAKRSALMLPPEMMTPTRGGS
jgi:hypothetical protein